MPSNHFGEGELQVREEKEGPTHEGQVQWIRIGSSFSPGGGMNYQGSALDERLLLCYQAPYGKHLRAQRRGGRYSS